MVLPPQAALQEVRGVGRLLSPAPEVVASSFRSFLFLGDKGRQGPEQIDTEAPPKLAAHPLQSFATVGVLAPGSG